MKRAVVFGIALLAAAISAIGLLHREEATDIRLTGIVSANEALVASEISGRIRELRVDEGDRVEKGQVIAVLATEEIDTQRQRQLAAIDQLSARLEQGEERVELETARVKSQIEAATAQLRASESQREEIRAELDQAMKDLERTSELLTQGLVARQVKEREESVVEVIRARMRTADDRVEAARAELEIHRASERQVRVMEQEVQQTEAQAAQARAELKQIAVRLGYTELRSPLTGVVSIRVAREGEFVAAGSPVVTVVDLNDVWVRAEVEETLLGRLVLGQPLEVILASDLALVGKVTFISPEAGFATQRDVDRVKRDIRTFAIKVALDNPDGRIHPGMTAFVVVPGEEAPPTARRDENEAPVLPAETEPGPATERLPVLTGTAIAAPAPKPPVPAPVPTQTRPEQKPRPTPRDVSQAGNPVSTAPPKPASVTPVARESPVPERPVTSASPASAKSTAREDRAARVSPPVPESERIENTASEPPPNSARPASPAAPASPSLEELLENIDIEDPTEADLALLEAALDAETATGEGAAGRRGASKPEAPAVTRAPPPPDPPPLQLEGISVADGKPFAIINGARVIEGDSVGGARVVRITQDSVVLDFGGRSITLRF